MRYEKTTYVGDVSTTHDYEGTPEEITKLVAAVEGEEAPTFTVCEVGEPEPEERHSQEYWISGPNKNTVTAQQIQTLLNNSEYDVKTIFGKVTIVTAKLPNGFTIVESSACVDPANYNEEIGVNICKGRIEQQLWQLEGYLLQEYLYRKGDF